MDRWYVEALCLRINFTYTIFFRVTETGMLTRLAVVHSSLLHLHLV
jgi:hypothetical protein